MIELTYDYLAPDGIIIGVVKITGEDKSIIWNDEGKLNLPQGWTRCEPMMAGDWETIRGPLSSLTLPIVDRRQHFWNLQNDPRTPLPFMSNISFLNVINEVDTPIIVEDQR